MVFNPKTKLVSPQYHCVFDEGFDTAVSTCDKKGLQEKIFQSLTFLGDESDHWEYVDKYENNSSRMFFDNTWNLEAMVEDMKEKKATLQRELINKGFREAKEEAWFTNRFWRGPPIGCWHCSI